MMNRDQVSESFTQKAALLADVLSRADGNGTVAPPPAPEPPPDPRPGAATVLAALSSGDYLGARRDAKAFGLEDLIPPAPGPVDQGPRMTTPVVREMTADETWRSKSAQLARLAGYGSPEPGRTFVDPDGPQAA